MSFGDKIGLYLTYFLLFTALAPLGIKPSVSNETACLAALSVTHCIDFTKALFTFWTD
jgi:hypothetical protein